MTLLFHLYFFSDTTPGLLIISVTIFWNSFPFLIIHYKNVTNGFLVPIKYVWVFSEWSHKTESISYCESVLQMNKLIHYEVTLTSASLQMTFYFTLRLICKFRRHHTTIPMNVLSHAGVAGGGGVGWGVGGFFCCLARSVRILYTVDT